MHCFSEGDDIGVIKRLGAISGRNMEKFLAKIARLRVKCAKARLSRTGWFSHCAVCAGWFSHCVVSTCQLARNYLHIGVELDCKRLSQEQQ